MPRDEPAPRRARRPRHADEDLDVGVLRGALCPPVPEVEVECLLGVGADNEGVQTAEVVVELDENRVE